MNNPQYRLINPAKTQIGKISKSILQTINSNIRHVTKLKQWRNTQAAIDWFNDINFKTRMNFIQLDIVSFYPSISENLFKLSLNFAKETNIITPTMMSTLLHARKSLLYNKQEPWVKKDSLFDVTMGAFDGAEVCELVGLFILSILQVEHPDLNIGLYRDDGLGVHRRIPGPALERKKKSIIQLFKDLGLQITIETNLNQVDFLDITLNLKEETYFPYRKPNNSPLYINIESNHPKNVIDDLPRGINKRLNEISANKDAFESCKADYQDALEKSGYKAKLKYVEKGTEESKKKRKRKPREIIWYTPPFNCQVTTNVGKEFLKIIDRHFPKRHPLNKVLNRKTLKIGYSCTRNMKAIINGHNQKIMQQRNSQNNANEQEGCNCKQRQECPLDGKCQVKGIIYKASLPSGETYTGSTKTTFKSRFNAHKSTFRNEKYRKSITLASHIWDTSTDPKFIKWSILQRAKPYSAGQKSCSLCLSEKLHILKNKDTKSLNRRDEVAQRCPHVRAYKLSAYKPP